MKKIYKLSIYALVLLGVSVCMSSCKKFLTVEPINKFSSDTFFKSESEMELFANGFINSWLPTFEDGDQAGGGNGFNDLIATKASTDYFHEPNIWGPSKQGGWASGDFNWARRVNFMIEGMNKNAKGAVSDEVFNHYMGVARFWRGQRCYSRVKQFVNAKWIDKYLQPDDSTTLYTDRDDHQYIMHNILEDFKFAAENVSASSKYHTPGRGILDKYVVCAWASRICLYEGSYLKYHEVNPATGQPWKTGTAPWGGEYETSTDFFQAAADFANIIIESKAFKLSSNYKDLFTGNKIDQDECIWGREYGEAIALRHNYTRYFNSSTLGQQYSGTKELVQHFLNADGTVASPYQSFNKEFTGRDPRLAVTVLGPDFVVIGAEKDPFPNFLWCMTGYQICKFFVPEATHLQNGVDENCLNYMRYAEVLLNYAEAKEELGQMDEGIWNKTVGALRERAGVRNISPWSAEYKADEWLRNYYTKNVNILTAGVPFNLSDVALEIRRERVCELTYECGLRQDDLYRWRMADLVQRRHLLANGTESGAWAGLWLTKEEYENGFKIKENSYTISPKASGTTEKSYKISQPTKGNWTVEEVGGGYQLLYHYPLGWHDEYMYARPMPTSAMTLNKNLTQTYGWTSE